MLHTESDQINNIIFCDNKNNSNVCTDNVHIFIQTKTLKKEKHDNVSKFLLGGGQEDNFIYQLT